MIRLADRCTLLVAGALLGFAAARAGSVPAPTVEARDVAGRGSTMVGGADVATPASGPRAGAPIDPARASGPPEPSLDDQVPPGLVPRTRVVSAAGVPLTDDEIDRCLSVARDINQDLHAGLLALRDADPARFRAQLEGSTRLRALARLERDTPHVYQLKIIELRNGRTVKRLIGDLQSAARSADEGTVETIAEQLRTEMRIEQAFRLLGRKEYLDQLRDRLERLEAQYRTDVTTVDERIAARIDRLVAEARSGGAVGSETGASAADTSEAPKVAGTASDTRGSGAAASGRRRGP